MIENSSSYFLPRRYFTCSAASPHFWTVEHGGVERGGSGSRVGEQAAARLGTVWIQDRRTLSHILRSHKYKVKSSALIYPCARMVKLSEKCLGQAIFSVVLIWLLNIYKSIHINSSVIFFTYYWESIKTVKEAHAACPPPPLTLH
jgi:hypothetical protein